MRGGQAQEPPAPADDEPPDDAHVHRARRRRLQVPVAVRQAAEDVPPVGHDGDEARHCPARLQVLRHEPSPSVLVLVFVEVVLAVATVTAGPGERLGAEPLVVRDKRTAVPASADPVLDEVELRLDGHGRALPRASAPSRPRGRGDAPGVLRGPSQEDAAPGPFPAAEPDGRLLGLPSRADASPVAVVLHPPEQRQHGLRAPDPEQEPQSAAFGLAHVPVAAVARVAAYEPRPLPRREPVDDLPEPRHPASSRMPSPRLDVHAQRDADRPDEVRMEVVARASGLLRAVSGLRTFLMAEDGLHRVVDVEDVLVGEEPVEDVPLVPREPGVQLPPVCGLERAPDAVLADDAAEPEQRREHGVVPQPVDVDVSREAADDGQDGRADDVPDLGRVGAPVAERGVPDEPVEEPARLQVGHEVGEAAPLRDLRSGIPAHVELPAECGDVDGLCRRERLG